MIVQAFPSTHVLEDASSLLIRKYQIPIMNRSICGVDVPMCNLPIPNPCQRMAADILAACHAPTTPKLIPKVVGYCRNVITSSHSLPMVDGSFQLTYPISTLWFMTFNIVFFTTSTSSPRHPPASCRSDRLQLASRTPRTRRHGHSGRREHQSAPRSISGTSPGLHPPLRSTLCPFRVSFHSANLQCKYSLSLRTPSYPAHSVDHPPTHRCMCLRSCST